MRRYFADLVAVLKGDGIALDDTEGAIIGVPAGETISLFAAIEARHGWVLAKLACAFFSLAIQPHHCANQLPGGRDMNGEQYLRAIVCLLAPLVVVGVLVRFVL